MNTLAQPTGHTVTLVCATSDTRIIKIMWSLASGTILPRGIYTFTLTTDHMLILAPLQGAISTYDDYANRAIRVTGAISEAVTGWDPNNIDVVTVTGSAKFGTTVSAHSDAITVSVCVPSDWQVGFVGTSYVTLEISGAALLL
jgi:hypothetical protein